MLSRVADNLYWMSRYLERAEHTARLVDVNLNLMLEGSRATAGQRCERVLRSVRTAPAAGGREAVVIDGYSVTHRLTFDRLNSSSIVACIGAARDNARQVREEICSELWEQLNRLYLEVRGASMEDVWNGQPHDFFQSVKDTAHLIQGVTDSTMSHGEGWQFIQVGRYIERAGGTATLLQVQFSELLGAQDHPVDSDNYLDWVGLLKSCTAFEAYCKVYTAAVRPERIAEFLLLDTDFPHSLRFAIDMLHAALHAIADLSAARHSARLERLAGRLSSTLRFGQIDEIMGDGLHPYLRYIQEQCAQIHTALQQIYFAYLVEEALAS